MMYTEHKKWMIINNQDCLKSFDKEADLILTSTNDITVNTVNTVNGIKIDHFKYSSKSKLYTTINFW